MEVKWKGITNQSSRHWELRLQLHVGEHVVDLPTFTHLPFSTFRLYSNIIQKKNRKSKQKDQGWKKTIYELNVMQLGWETWYLPNGERGHFPLRFPCYDHAKSQTTFNWLTSAPLPGHSLCPSSGCFENQMAGTNEHVLPVIFTSRNVHVDNYFVLLIVY